jgi:hypothetical protein
MKDVVYTIIYMMENEGCVILRRGGNDGRILFGCLLV